MSSNEAETRKQLIDRQIAKAGWNLLDRNEVKLEVPASGDDDDWTDGITDYSFYLPNGEIIVVVEAKRQSRSPHTAREQALIYARKIERNQSFRPLVFLANGIEIWFWDTEDETPREVTGFFSREDLERLLFVKKNKTSLADASINADVSGRLYQQEAIRRVSTAFDADKKRRALLVMATGTGKTRTSRMMVQMIDPKVNERICDPAAGTCGFLVNAYQYILEKNTSKDILTYDEEGMPHNLAGDLLDERSEEFLQTEALTGFDSDSGMTMLRIGSMNLMLHGIKHPRFFYNDTLSKTYTEERRYDVVLANPPFKGAIDASSIGEDLPANVKKTELLFQHLFLRILEMGGRCAVIVPDGVLFGSSNAHVAVRKKLINENRLEAVVSMPSGVFKPYAGVSTAILIFTKGGATDRIWFYDMANDGFSLDDKRQKQADNDIPDILECWRNRRNEEFHQSRARRLADLQESVAPMKTRRLELNREINRLNFESVVAPPEDETARIALETEEKLLAELTEQIAPLQKEIDQLTRQFWVTKKDVQANKYDLSASRYRRIEADETFYEEPNITLERLNLLENVMIDETKELQKIVISVIN